MKIIKLFLINLLTIIAYMAIGAILCFVFGTIIAVGLGADVPQNQAIISFIFAILLIAALMTFVKIKK